MPGGLSVGLRPDVQRIGRVDHNITHPSLRFQPPQRRSAPLTASHRRCRRDQLQPQQVRAATDRDQPGWRAARQPAQDGGFSRDTDAQSVLGTFSFVLAVLMVLVRSSSCSSLLVVQQFSVSESGIDAI